MSSHTQVTQLLQDWRNGSQQALDQLIPLVYSELKRIARSAFAGEPTGHTLQPTALVNEALLRLSDSDISWQDRCHFIAMMTTTMRRVLVDHARKRRSEKRGGDALRVTLSADQSDGEAAPDVLDLDEAMLALASHDQRKADVVQLHYFGGMRYDEIAEAMSLSEATVHRELKFSRVWLKEFMHR